MLSETGSQKISFNVSCKITVSEVTTSNQNKRDNPYVKSINREVHKFNRLSSKLAWDAATGKINMTENMLNLAAVKSHWVNSVCRMKLDIETFEEKRQMYLLCRGPEYSAKQAR